MDKNNTSGTGTGKKTLILGSLALLNQMEQHLRGTGCTVHCSDYDGNWFIVYSEPAAAAH